MSLFCSLILLSSVLAASADAGSGYRVEQRETVWRLVAPDGKAFFSRGVCCANMGTDRSEYDAAKPAYAAWQQYDDPVSWADATLRRLRSWGFTTIGGWSDYASLRRSRRMDMSFTPVLHIGSTSGAPWFDMWDPKVIARMDDVAREQILPIRDDPRLLGYYSDNEMGWWNAALFKITLEQAAASGQRRRLVKLLRDQYRGHWDALLRDFEPQGASGFAELDRAGVLYLRPGGSGIHVVRRFLGIAAARYYELTRQIIRKYDRRALILGDRYQSFYYPEVARAARSVDVVSTNLNANWNDGSFARFYLETLYALAGKPILIGEFYMTARENRSGNKNDSSGFPVVQTQRERAKGFRNTLTALQRLPYVVGADWFQYYDEPTFGRGDGENYNMGLVDIHDRPYPELTAAAASLAQPALRQASTAKRPDASGGVPRAPREPAADLKPMLALKSWDRERGYVQPTSRFPIADLYLCWDPDGVYLGLLAMDFAEDTYYADKRIPEADRMEWLVQVKSKGEPIRARLGAGRAPSAAGPAATVVSPSDRGQDVRIVALMKLPASTWGKSKLRPGDRITLHSSLLTHARAYRVAWAGSFTLAE